MGTAAQGAHNGGGDHVESVYRVKVFTVAEVAVAYGIIVVAMVWEKRYKRQQGSAYAAVARYTGTRMLCTRYK